MSTSYYISFAISAIIGGLSVIALGRLWGFLVWLAKRSLDIIPTRYQPAENPADEHIQILVVGDIGRSPRMQYHALSVAKHGRKVDIVGYKGKQFISCAIIRLYLFWVRRDGQTSRSHRQPQRHCLSSCSSTRMDRMGNASFFPKHPLQGHSAVLDSLRNTHVHCSPGSMDHHSGNHKYL